MFLKTLLIAQLLFTPVDTGRFTVSIKSNALEDSAIVKVFPVSITRVVADLGSHCHMFMFRDSSFVLRTFQKADTLCVRKFNLIPSEYRKTSGYYQQRVDTICLLSERDTGCDFDVVFNMFKTFSNGWPQCTPYVTSCGTLTTVMDYDAIGKEKYENGVYWCSSRSSYGPLLVTDECMWSGWEYPLRGFPGRWETADNWIFFTRKPN
jgi:hypothetical protein